MYVTSLQNTKIKTLKQLQRKKYRDKSRYYFTETEHLIEEALQAGCLHEVYIDARYEYIDHQIFRDEQCIIEDTSLVNGVYEITDEISKSISMLSSESGIYGLIEKKDTAELGDVILILDGVQDPGNVGTIMRSALSFGVTDIVATSDAADFYNDKVIRASQGAIFKLNLMRLGVEEINEKIGAHVACTYLLDIDGKSLANHFDLPQRFAIVAGREGEGIRYENWQHLVHEKVTIPMQSQVESLNVSVATSIALYEFSKK